jgi:hypothetical protein
MAVCSLWEGRAPGTRAAGLRAAVEAIASALCPYWKAPQASLGVLGADSSGVFPEAAVFVLILRQARQCDILGQADRTSAKDEEALTAYDQSHDRVARPRSASNETIALKLL